MPKKKTKKSNKKLKSVRVKSNQVVSSQEEPQNEETTTESEEQSKSTEEPKQEYQLPSQIILQSEGTNPLSQSASDSPRPSRKKMWITIILSILAVLIGIIVYLNLT